jgi:hypothetical protein
VKAEVIHPGHVLRGVQNRMQLIRIKRSADFILAHKHRAGVVFAQINEQASKVGRRFDCPSRPARFEQARG